MATKGAAPAALSRGLFLDAGRQLVLNCLRATRHFSTKKKMALHKHFETGET
jgi:hypothetical protein